MPFYNLKPKQPFQVITKIKPPNYLGYKQADKITKPSHIELIKTNNKNRIFNSKPDYIFKKHEKIIKFLKKSFSTHKLNIHYPIQSSKNVLSAQITKKNISIEILYNFVSIDWVLHRKAQLKKQGFETLWLLNDKKFNKKFLSEAEINLRENLSYFFKNSSKEPLIIYDQFEILDGNKRILKGKKLPIFLNTIHKTPKNFEGMSQIENICKNSNICFTNDRVFIATNFHSTDLIKYWEMNEHQLKKRNSLLKILFKNYFLRPYNSILDSVLRKIT